MPGPFRVGVIGSSGKGDYGHGLDARVVKKLKRTDGPLKYEFETLKMMLFSAELSV